ncbi:unnamed protein product [Adineta steineri]|uniref:Uncharacterized protein n=1 Tax=Adineta steineri TaxID=433720 RepID=A0A815PAU0_9BILA|nr:unnamed protein product [Adineta steineri]CAF1629291.1 unnamed protein product [Adineta steineri]
MVKSDQTIEPEKTNRFELTEHGRLLTSNHPSKIRYLLYWGIKSKKYTTIQQAKLGNEFDKQNISKDRYQFISGDMFDATTIPQAGAKERTQYQYEYLLKQGGFQLKQLHYTQTPISIIEAVPN